MEQSHDLSSGPDGGRVTPHAFMSTRMPVVLQHKGHSRTVVGIEFAKSGETNLLIYDPARCVCNVHVYLTIYCYEAFAAMCQKGN
jgi:hypothetical protein